MTIDTAADGAQTVETEEVKEAVKEEVKEEEAKVEKKQDSVAKLLAQRNEFKTQLAAERAKNVETEGLSEKFKALEELVASQALAAESAQEKSAFFTENGYAKEFESDIEAVKSAKNLSYDEAAKLVIAEKKPELLLEDAVRNKMSGGAPLTGVANPTTIDKDNPTAEDVAKMSDDEFIKRGNDQAKKERMDGGRIR